MQYRKSYHVGSFHASPDASSSYGSEEEGLLQHDKMGGGWNPEKSPPSFKQPEGFFFDISLVLVLFLH
jgi:hypothetical protein